MDGLYRYQRGNITAGFIVEGGKVTWCAPYLRRFVRDGIMDPRIMVDVIPVQQFRGADRQFEEEEEQFEETDNR